MPNYPQYYNPYQQQIWPNPYPDRLTQLQMQQPQYGYQQQIPQMQMQQQMQPQMQQQRQYGLNGQIVDGIEAVKAKDVDLTGNPTYYPQSDGKAIFVKQMQMDGTCRTLTYKLEETQNNESAKNTDISVMFDNLKQDLFAEISVIRELIGNINVADTSRKGGTAK